MGNNNISFLYGTLLGDSWLRVEKPKSGNRKYRYGCEQISKQLITEKRNILSDYLDRDIPVHKRQRNGGISPISGNSFENLYPIYRVEVGFKGLEKYYGLYRKGKKTVTKNWLKKLTPLALAHWYMDDGFLYTQKSRNGYKVYLCTDAFDLFSCKLITQYFSEVLQLSTKVYTSSSGVHHKTGKPYLRNRIVFSMTDAQRFLAMIYPFMVSDFHYKAYIVYRNEGRYIPEYLPIMQDITAQGTGIKPCYDIV